jgi:hypothetical protein
MANRTYLHNVTLPEPVIDGLLPDVPGGDSNLLPETLTHEDLKVWFTPPQYSDPTLDKETVELFVDYVDDTSVPICVREWTTPIQAPDQFVWLPRAWLANERNQGQHRLSYRFTVYNNEHDQSNDLLITLDIVRDAGTEGDVKRYRSGAVSRSGKVGLAPFPQLYRVGADAVATAMGLYDCSRQPYPKAFARDPGKSTAEQLLPVK